MIVSTTLKLVLRNWWRNKLFFLISVLSLTIGLGCTNLLFTFFIHEYNIESQTPAKERIYSLRQDAPMKEGEKVAYATAEIPGQIKEKYAEVEDFLRINSLSVQSCKYGEEVYEKVKMIGTDSTLLHFFNYSTSAGDLKEVLTSPDKVALTRSFAQKLFGNENGLGKMIELSSENKVTSYRVVAILNDRPQSFLHFDILTGISTDFWGGVTLLKLRPDTDPKVLEAKIKQDKIPTLLPSQTQYYVDPIKEMYFLKMDGTNHQVLGFIQQRDVELLYIGLISALLVLVMACFNYTNLNLSRTLQQLRMIHVEKLMGGTLKDIRLQLFSDASLTVLLAFILSFLLINDLLPWFNGLLTSYMTFGFFFSWQVLPLLLLFVILMAVLPGWFISRRLSRQSLSEYKTAYTGRKKQRLVSVLVTLQFFMSIALVYASMVAEGQINLTKNRAFRYENMIEIGSMMGPSLVPFHRVLEKMDGVASVTLSQGSVLNAWLRELQVKQPDGSLKRTYLLTFPTDTTFLHTLKLRQLSGQPLAESRNQYVMPAFINQVYAKTIGVGQEQFGHKLREFDNMIDSSYVFAGIMEDFPVNSLEEEVTPQCIVFMPDDKMQQANYLQVRLLPEQYHKTMADIRKTYKEMFDNEMEYQDMHQTFMKRNEKVTTLSKVLISYSSIALILTCFGLFGISWYAVRQRIREIAIRKVHGASTLQIIWALNRPFMIQILIAYIVALPVVYGLMQHWLEQFAYRTSPSLWHFISPLLIVFAISIFTVTLHSWLAAHTSPIHSLKVE